MVDETTAPVEQRHLDRAKALVDEHIQSWGWVPRFEIEGTCEYDLAIKAAAQAFAEVTRAEQPRPTETREERTARINGEQIAESANCSATGKADAGLAGDIAELALAADFGGNDIAGLRQGIIGDAAIQAFVDAIAALTTDGVAAENEACAKVLEVQAEVIGALPGSSIHRALECAAFSIRARMGDR